MDQSRPVANTSANYWWSHYWWSQAAALAGTALTAEVEAPLGVAKCACTSQTLAHSMMVPPATTNRMIPQSHQSFLSRSFLIVCITARWMCGSALWRPAACGWRVDFPHASHDIAVALTLPWSTPALRAGFVFAMSSARLFHPAIAAWFDRT